MQGKLIYEEAGFPIGKLAPFSFMTFLTGKIYKF